MRHVCDPRSRKRVPVINKTIRNKEERNKEQKGMKEEKRRDEKRREEKQHVHSGRSTQPKTRTKHFTMDVAQVCTLAVMASTFMYRTLDE